MTFAAAKGPVASPGWRPRASAGVAEPWPPRASRANLAPPSQENAAA